MKVSAVVVSRMDRPIGKVLNSILPHVEDLIVVRGHAGVWERWEAAAAARQAIVYTQDDDAIVDVASVLAAYKPGVATCNMPADRRAEYRDSIALVGWGAVFDRSMAHMSHYDFLYTGGPFDWRNANGQYDAFVAYHLCMMEQRTREGIPEMKGEDFRSKVLLDPIFRSECDRVFTGLSPLNLVDVPFEHQDAAFGAGRMGRRPCHAEYMAEIRRRIYAARSMA